MQKNAYLQDALEESVLEGILHFRVLCEERPMSLRTNTHFLGQNDGSFAREVALHIAGVKPEQTVNPKIASRLSKMGFRHLAGNVFELPAKNEFWEVRGGSIVKLTGSEVDAGEKLVSADADNPESSLQNFLYDLTF